jgi:hypothetical protein
LVESRDGTTAKRELQRRSSNPHDKEVLFPWWEFPDHGIMEMFGWTEQQMARHNLSREEMVFYTSASNKKKDSPEKAWQMYTKHVEARKTTQASIKIPRLQGKKRLAFLDEEHNLEEKVVSPRNNPVAAQQPILDMMRANYAAGPKEGLEEDEEEYVYSSDDESMAPWHPEEDEQDVEPEEDNEDDEQVGVVEEVKEDVVQQAKESVGEEESEEESELEESEEESEDNNATEDHDQFDPDIISDDVQYMTPAEVAALSQSQRSETLVSPDCSISPLTSNSTTQPHSEFVQQLRTNNLVVPPFPGNANPVENALDIEELWEATVKSGCLIARGRKGPQAIVSITTRMEVDNDNEYIGWVAHAEDLLGTNFDLSRLRAPNFLFNVTEYSPREGLPLFRTQKEAKRELMWGLIFRATKNAWRRKCLQRFIPTGMSVGFITSRFPQVQLKVEVIGEDYFLCPIEGGEDRVWVC